MPDVFRHTGAKKSIHVNLIDSTHMALRIQSFRLKLSIQEMMEEFAQKVIIEDPVVMGFLRDLACQKKNKEFKRVTNIDANAIYDMIDDGNPNDGELNS